MQLTIRVIDVRKVIHSYHLDLLHRADFLHAVNDLAPVVDGVAVATMSRFYLTFRGNALNFRHRQPFAMTTAPHV